MTPELGALSGGSSQQFILRFSPREVEDVSRTIVCHMPVLEQLAAAAGAAVADALKQLVREVTGKVRSSIPSAEVMGLLPLGQHLSVSASAAPVKPEHLPICIRYRHAILLFACCTMARQWHKSRHQCCCCYQVLRPWCHFELPDSDYLSAGRRNPELPGPSGVVEPLDPTTKASAAG